MLPGSRLTIPSHISWVCMLSGCSLTPLSPIPWVLLGPPYSAALPLFPVSSGYCYPLVFRCLLASYVGGGRRCVRRRGERAVPHPRRRRHRGTPCRHQRNGILDLIPGGGGGGLHRKPCLGNPLQEIHGRETLTGRETLAGEPLAEQAWRGTPDRNRLGWGTHGRISLVRKPW